MRWPRFCTREKIVEFVLTDVKHIVMRFKAIILIEIESQPVVSLHRTKRDVEPFIREPGDLRKKRTDLSLS